LLLSPGAGTFVVLIGDGLGDDPPEPGPAIMPVTTTHYESGRVVVESNVGRDGWLVLSDRYFPGWFARLDGEPVSIERANVMVRAVRVPAGKHAVEFRYAPASLRIGGLVSLAGWAVAAVLWGVAGWRGRRGILGRERLPGIEASGQESGIDPGGGTTSPRRRSSSSS
jgi:hypothetical protein